MESFKKWINRLIRKQGYDQTLVDETSEDSFPASDPPSWTAGEARLHEKQPPEKSDLQLSENFLESVKQTLVVDGKTYHYFSLPHAEQAGLKDLSRLPITLKILLENLLRHHDEHTVTLEDIKAVVDWLNNKKSAREIAWRPGRVLMQDFTGVPAVVDLAAMRDAIRKLGGDPERINPLSPVDLVIDHSIQVDEFIVPDAFAINARMEMQRNHERYAFLRWGQHAFKNFRVVPPDTGICHQVNLEYLAKGVWSETKDDVTYAYPDTLVGTDSHTTMINGLGVLGWGVGGIEAEAAMLGQPISMLIPEVIGVRLAGKLQEGVTATDLVLVVTNLLRTKGVVSKFVEFFGPGLANLSIADRATIGNMSPEYGATCGFSPLDEAALDYLQLSGRDAHTIALVKAYAKAQGLWHDENSPEPLFTDVVSLDLSTIRPCMAGPKRPQDKVALKDLGKTFDQLLADNGRAQEKEKTFATQENADLHHGDVVIAAITSCTNTSNPDVLVAAGLVAKKALAKGLKRQPWVKTSFAPGSQVVTTYLEETGLQQYLNELGFTLVGYGCTTCIGNSGPLPEAIEKTVTENDLIVSAVLSGNRNFEGRIHPLVKANWLASPPLVVVFALTGRIDVDLDVDPVGHNQQGEPVYLKEIWPTREEIAAETAKITGSMFHDTYDQIFEGTEEWKDLQVPASDTYVWLQDSTYIQHPPFFDDMSMHPPQIQDIHQAHILALLGDSITTDHISPAGSIKPDSPAGKYLQSQGVAIKDFNSYGARRGNHEVMVRGTFANIRIRNEMVPGTEGGYTKYIPTGEILSIYDAAMRYKTARIPLVVIAGKEYGTGSSRDWAAKGPKLQGVVAVIAESFERIHRSNLIGMGILPLEFTSGITRHTLKLDGNEKLDILGIGNDIRPNMDITLRIKRPSGSDEKITVRSRIDTVNEMDYFKQGGILQHVLRNLMETA